jgi:hypothetical protein
MSPTARSRTFRLRINLRRNQVGNLWYPEQPNTFQDL